MEGDDFVSLDVAVAVLLKYSYRPAKNPPPGEGVIFESFRPHRRKLKRIAFNEPNCFGPNGEPGYTEGKLVETICCTYGISYMGEVIATIRLTRQELH